MYKTDKIVIVGGGSAGWMTAATLIRYYPEKDITLIESPNIPNIGVGESTLGGIKSWMSALGILDREKEFMQASDATYKMSIKFTDFGKVGDGGYHYPFGQPHLTNRANWGLLDWQIKKVLKPETPLGDYVDTFFPAMALINKNKIADVDGIFGNFRFDSDVAYQIDATKFGTWLKTEYCIPKGVKHISDEVVDIKTNELGIESLTLQSGKIITSDLFIDCTGFRSLLLEQTLKEPFVYYDDLIPTTHAWATRIPFVDKEKEMEIYTNCTAIQNGWVWNIPLWSRLGSGYAYSSKHISKEDALKQFKQYLKSDKILIPRTDEQIEQLEFRHVEMKIGIHKRTWVKNVLAIGLSAGFLEPLESNGLYTVHEFLVKVVNTLSRGHINQWDLDTYNTATTGMFQNFAEFISLHYALSTRMDSQFWKDFTSKTLAPDVIAQKPSMAVGFWDLMNKKMFSSHHSPFGGIHCIAVGSDYLLVDKMTLDIWAFRDGIDYGENIKEVELLWDREKEYWNSEAEKAVSHYEFLKLNIYDTN